jgi:hypothetical protein
MQNTCKDRGGHGVFTEGGVRGKAYSLFYFFFCLIKKRNKKIKTARFLPHKQFSIPQARSFRHRRNAARAVRPNPRVPSSIPALGSANNDKSKTLYYFEINSILPVGADMQRCLRGRVSVSCYWLARISNRSSCPSFRAN